MKTIKKDGLVSLAMLVTLDDAVKSILLSAGIKTEYDFDLNKIARICKENGSDLNNEQIKIVILHHCNVLREKNQRVLKVETEDLSPTVLRVVFTVRLFRDDDLTLVSPDDLRTIISSGEWRRGDGLLVKEKM